MPDVDYRKQGRKLAWKTGRDSEILCKRDLGWSPRKLLNTLCNLVPLIAILAIKRLNVIQSYSVRSIFDIKKMNVELKLTAAGENFQNLWSFVEFGALFQQKVVKSGGVLYPTLKSAGALASAAPPRFLHPWLSYVEITTDTPFSTLFVAITTKNVSSKNRVNLQTMQHNII